MFTFLILGSSCIADNGQGEQSSCDTDMDCRNLSKCLNNDNKQNENEQNEAMSEANNNGGVIERILNGESNGNTAVVPAANLVGTIGGLVLSGIQSLRLLGLIQPPDATPGGKSLLQSLLK